MNRILPLAETAYQKIHDGNGEDHPEHQAVLDEIRRIGINSLTLEERGETDRYLKMAIEKQAEKTGAYIYKTGQDSNGRSYPCRVIDEQKFPQETGLLRQVVDKKRYSSVLEGWLAGKRHAFVDEIKADPHVMSAIQQWPAMSVAARGDLLKDLIRRRLESFSDDNFSFAMPEIEITNQKDDLSGGGGASYARQNRIEFPRSVLELDDSLQPLMFAYHEGTHNILTQFAMADKEGKISSNHPLYKDIQMARYAKDMALATPIELESFYNSDDEERLCYEEQEFFVINLHKGYGLRQKFDLVREVAHQYFKADNPPTLKQLIHELRCG